MTGAVLSTVQSAATGDYGVVSVTASFAGLGATTGGAAGAVFGADGDPSDEERVDDEDLEARLTKNCKRHDYIMREL